MTCIKKKVKLFFVLLGFSGFIFFVLYFFRLQNIQIYILDNNPEHLESIYTKQAYKVKIKKLLKPYIGSSLILLSFNKIFSILKKEDIFLKLSFKKQFPSDLKITFSLNPEFVLRMDKTGRLFKMLRNGKLIKIYKKKQYPGPIVTGRLALNKKQKKQFIHFVFNLLKLNVFHNKISTITYISKKEVHLFLDKPYLKIKLNWSRLMFKQAENLKAIEKKIQKVFKYLKQHSYKAKVLDARFVNKIFVSY